MPEAVTRARPIGYDPKELVGILVQGDQNVITLVEAGLLLAALLPLSNDDKLSFVAGKSPSRVLITTRAAFRATCSASTFTRPADA